MEPQNMDDQIEQPEVIENEQPEQIEQEATEVEEKPEEPQETEAEKRARKERNRAIREKYRAEAESKHLRERLETLENEAKQRRTEQPAELNPNQYNTQHEYEQALLDQRIEAQVSKRLDMERQASKQREEQVKVQATREEFARKAEEAKDAYPDFEEVVSSVAHIPLNQALERALVKAGNGPDLVYHLAKNPEEFERINRMHPIDAAFEIATLSAKVQRPQSKVSKAPTPIKPVTTASTSPSGEPDPSNQKAWLAWRTKQVHKQRT